MNGASRPAVSLGWQLLAAPNSPLPLRLRSGREAPGCALMAYPDLGPVCCSTAHLQPPLPTTARVFPRCCGARPAQPSPSPRRPDCRRGHRRGTEEAHDPHCDGRVGRVTGSPSQRELRTVEPSNLRTSDIAGRSSSSPCGSS